MPGPLRPVDELLRNSPELLDDVADHAGSWMLLRNGVLNIHGELDAEDARRIAGHTALAQIQFARRFEVSDETLRLLDDHVLTRHPQVGLRATLNGFGAFDDLEFLEYLPGLRSIRSRSSPRFPDSKRCTSISGTWPGYRRLSLPRHDRSRSRASEA